MRKSHASSPTEGPTISLVVATVGRVQELDRLLASVAAQSFQNLEVIIVDQTPADQIQAVVQRWGDSLHCIHVRSKRGLSLARNAGITLASGSIIAFPDDDCWYPQDLLSDVAAWFHEHAEYDFLCCTARDEEGREVASRWPKDSAIVNRNSVLRACASASMFLRRPVLEEIGSFDERFGLGAETPFQSAEDSDLALRCLAGRHAGWFERQLYVYHPFKGANGEASSARAFAYGMGFGHLLRRHNYLAHTWLYHVSRALGGAVKSLLLVRPTSARFYWQSALGRLLGYLTSGMAQQNTK